MKHISISLIISVHRCDDTRIFHRKAKSLVGRYEVELHAPADFKFKKVDGVKILGLPKVKRFLRPLNWLRLFLRILKLKADVCHFQDPELLPVRVSTKFFK